MTERAIKLVRKALMDPDAARALGAVRKLPHTHFHGYDEPHFGRYDVSIFCLSRAEETAGITVVGPHAELVWRPGWQTGRQRQKVRLMLFRHARHYNVGSDPIRATRHLSALSAADDFCERLEAALSPVRLGHASFLSSGMRPSTGLADVDRYLPGHTDD